MMGSLRGSTKTSTDPPQVRPISHASSSPNCILRSCGEDVPRTSPERSMTRASTHPPMVTDPKIPPSSPTNIFVPSLRGVVPAVRTSVAIAAGLPAWRSRSISSKVSCDMGVSLRFLFEGTLAALAAEVVAPPLMLRRVAGIGNRDCHLADRIEGHDRLGDRGRLGGWRLLQSARSPLADDF